MTMLINNFGFNVNFQYYIGTRHAFDIPLSPACTSTDNLLAIAYCRFVQCSSRFKITIPFFISSDLAHHNIIQYFQIITINNCPGGVPCTYTYTHKYYIYIYMYICMQKGSSSGCVEQNTLRQGRERRVYDSVGAGVVPRSHPPLVAFFILWFFSTLRCRSAVVFSKTKQILYCLK